MTGVDQALIGWRPGVEKTFGSEPLRLGHRLHRSPLFTDAALVRLIEGSSREDYYVNTMDVGAHNVKSRREGAFVDIAGADVLEAVRKGQIWILLQNPDRVDPAYGEILEGVYRELAHSVPGFRPFRKKMTVLISSPNIQVYYHCDVPGQTLLGLPRLLQDQGFRERCVARVTDPVVRQFWRLEYEGYDKSFRSEAIAPVLNKVGRVLATPALRNMIAQPTSSFDLRRMMDERRILVVNLAKGALGESTAALLGAFLITALAQAALSRSDTREQDRQPFYLYADEFQAYATDSFALILSEARKFGLSLTLCHQYIGQLGEPLRKAIVGTAGSFITFRLGADDADLMARNLGFRHPADLTTLANFQGVARLFDGDTLDDPRPFTLLAPLDARFRHPERLIANSRIRFGRDRKKIELRVERFMLGTS